jgi:hypothetical protein
LFSERQSLLATEENHVQRFSNFSSNPSLTVLSDFRAFNPNIVVKLLDRVADS